ncbi:MAG TPA: methanogenesis marker 7 protein [Candidatus Bathyarchaeia archaeon]|nr:methanogenesis marker 7 protein [Candidatus Bathyarchaeia archaeon]
MLEPLMYTGGVYRHDELMELVEDLGGYVLQKNVMQLEVVLLILVPADDLNIVEEKARELLGTIARAPLIGSEIAVVAPSLAYHHMPHPTCDIAEYLRRNGAKTNIIGLARGVGRRAAQLTKSERGLINEHDLAVFILGDFQSCIRDVKYQLYEDLEIPVIVTGGPECDAVPYAYAYIASIGRRAKAFHREAEFAILDELVATISKALDERREELEKDPLSVSPFRLRDEITQQIPEVSESLSPSPITIHLNGMRIKLPYDDYAEKVRNVKFVEGPLLSDAADVRPSHMREYLILKIKTKSVAGFAL